MTDGSTAPRRADIRRDTPDGYRAMAALTRAATLEHRLAEVVKVRVSQINGCAYCVDLHVRQAREAGETERRMHALAVWREAPFFDARERAALGLAEALTLLPSGPVPESAYAGAAQHFPEAELAALVLTITAINAWNRIMLATGAEPAQDV